MSTQQNVLQGICFKPKWKPPHQSTLWRGVDNRRTFLGYPESCAAWIWPGNSWMPLKADKDDIWTDRWPWSEEDLNEKMGPRSKPKGCVATARVKMRDTEPVGWPQMAPTDSLRSGASHRHHSIGPVFPRGHNGNKFTRTDSVNPKQTPKDPKFKSSMRGAWANRGQSLPLCLNVYKHRLTDPIKGNIWLAKISCFTVFSGWCNLIHEEEQLSFIKAKICIFLFTQYSVLWEILWCFNVGI